MGSEIKVLIVDDDDVILFLHELMIRDSGLSQDTTCFLTAQAALDHLDAQPAGTQQVLVFLDINMPGLSGWNFLEKLEDTACKERVSVVLVTSSIDYADHRRSEDYPAVIEYIEKPLTLETCRRLREVILK
ncbi:MAG TPA: response regulator [Sphingobacteriaceae bacterium]